MRVAKYEQAESKYERDQRIEKMRQRGMTLREIGREVGMSANGVMHVLNRLGGKGWDDDDSEYYV